MSNTPPLPSKKYDIVYADPPWPYFGSTVKNAAAGKHYDLMTIDEIKNIKVKSILNRPGAVFLWCTAPKLHYGIETLNAWGLHYRGVAHVWIKTRRDGKIIQGQGVPPTYSKPTSEYLLLGTTRKNGRPFKLLDHKLPQVVLAPRGKHSEKPAVFRNLIEQAYGKRPRLEMFARGSTPGWDVWGLEALSVVPTGNRR